MSEWNFMATHPVVVYTFHSDVNTDGGTRRKFRGLPRDYSSGDTEHL